MSILQHKDYRSYLKGTLADRARENPSYSLRALARQLSVAPSFLSAVLKGEKNLSPERAITIATKLGLTASETEYFCALVQLEGTNDPALRETYYKRAESLNPTGLAHDLSLDHFRIIADWQHFAIMASTELSAFHATAENFAAKLGISRAEAELSLERLVRLEMIEKDEKGAYRKTNSNPRVVSHSPNKALRSFHRQTLSKAIESLETQTPKEKVVGSETFAIDTSQLEEFRDLANQFFDQALALAKKAKKKDHVYHLGVQFFNLTKKGK